MAHFRRGNELLGNYFCPLGFNSNSAVKFRINIQNKHKYLFGEGAFGLVWSLVLFLVWEEKVPLGREDS